MIIKRFEVGPLFVNCYLIGCEQTRLGAVIDPGDEADMLLEQAQSLGLQIQQIINTHGHSDHIADNKEVKALAGAKIYIHPADADMLTDPRKNLSAFFGEAIVSPPADAFLQENQIHKLGRLEFKILHIPGHSPGSACLLHHKTAFTGDTIFAGSIGRTDFPGGSYELLISGIRTKILTLSGDYALLPGHGPITSVEEERLYNPFFS